ncbi:uncharacterized protein B0H18DRAFT_961978 [Fomitopsis serialis]|uniref:uncharacterized protein n=1 Tax=Fomitopsis serialis TaxID=139415 RepID=UPI0020083EB6|nr:uncharacterized protein B0H18DRAFT_961978 [Neoantrodia serialis]KAH9911634.1 hypothetical protein B0H18DRAFT_961978 [Neoantrodia serialis]
MSYRRSLSSPGLLPPRSLLRNAASLTALVVPYIAGKEEAGSDSARSEHSTSDSESATSETARSLSAPSPGSSQVIYPPPDRQLRPDLQLSPVPLLSKVFGKKAIRSPLWPELYDFERVRYLEGKLGRELTTEPQEVEITQDEWKDLVVYLNEHGILLKFFSFHYNSRTLKLYMASVSGAHQRVILEFWDLSQMLFDICVLRGNRYKIILGGEHMKTIAGPIMDPYQIISTIHIPDIVIKIVYKDGEYEVGVIEVGFTEPWDSFKGRMRGYRFVSTRKDNSHTWPVFVGGIKMFEHTRFRRPKVTTLSSTELDEWRVLPLTDLAELPEEQAVPEGGEVDDEDVDKIAEPAPGGPEYALTRCIVAKGRVWCGELSAWFVLFEVSRYLSDEERTVINEGLTSGLSLEEWARLGYALPMIDNYKNYPKQPYELFCWRYRRIFGRARFEMWRHGFKDWNRYKAKHTDDELFRTAEDVERDFNFTALGTQMKFERDNGLPESFKLPFDDIVESIRHGAMCCARQRLETFQRLLPGEPGFAHTSLGDGDFVIDTSLETDEEIDTMVATNNNLDLKKKRLARVRELDEEMVNEERRQRPRLDEAGR